MTSKITKLYGKKWSGFSSLGTDGFFTLVCCKSTAPVLLHGRPASLVTVGGLNGGKRPKELPLLRYIFQGELMVACFAWPKFQITHILSSVSFLISRKTREGAWHARLEVDSLKGIRLKEVWMGDIREYRIQTCMKIGICISTPGEADLFIPLGRLYLCSSVCDHCSRVGHSTFPKPNQILGNELSGHCRQ